jgi:hypothetical protein
MTASEKLAQKRLTLLQLAEKFGNVSRIVERFNRTVLDEFFRTAFRKWLYEAVDAFQKDLDDRPKALDHRPHRGHRNQGRRHLETFELGINRREELKKKAA